MKVFLPSFGFHNPFVGDKLQTLGSMPIALEGPDGYDLDYSSLLVAESFIIDQRAVDFVEENRDSSLGPMSKSLAVLHQEGLLEVRCFADLCEKYKGAIVEKTESLLETIDPWLRITRKQWFALREDFGSYASRWSPADRKEFDAAHFGVVNYLHSRDGGIAAKEMRRLHALLESRRMRLSQGEYADAREILKPLVAEIVFVDLMRHLLQAPFIGWDDAQEFHDRLYRSQWIELDSSGTPGSSIASQSRHLFQTVLPELLPGRIEDVVRFTRNRKAVTSLREELWSLLREGQSVSKDWMLRFQAEAIRAQLRAEKRQRIVKWAGRAANMMLPIVGTVADALMEAGEEVAEAVSTKKGKQRFAWYYALQRIQQTRSG